MGIIDRIAALPRDLRKRLSYNSNNNNYYSNKLGAYGSLRHMKAASATGNIRRYLKTHKSMSQ